MAYTKLPQQPPRRAPGLAWEDNAPGLYVDEIAILLDTGQQVAVSVETKWAPGNTGLALHAWARLIKPDGSSQEDPDGKVVETSMTINVPQDMVKKYGEKVLAKEIMHAVLGEAPTAVKVVVDKKLASADAAAAPEGTILQPAVAEQSLLAFSDEVRRNASIRLAIDTMKIVESGINPGAALGL